MRAIKGFITSKRNQSLVIKLETGVTITKTSHQKLEVGDHIVVGYDYTNSKYTTVIKTISEISDNGNLEESDEYKEEVIYTDNFKSEPLIEQDFTFDLEFDELLEYW